MPDMKRPLVRLAAVLACFVVPAGATPAAVQEGDAPAAPPARGPQDPAADDGAPAEKQPPAAVLGFRWGPGGTVPVVETYGAGPQAIVSEYSVGWKKDGPGLVLARSTPEYKSIGGKEIPAGAPQLQQRRVQDMLTPGVKLDPKGNFMGFASLKAVEMQLQKLEQGGDAALVQAVREGQKNKAMTMSNRQRMRDAWEIWSGMWAGTTLSEGQVADYERLVYPGVGMKRLPAQVHAECVETLERGGVRCIRVKLDIVQEGDEFARSLQETIASVPGAEQLQKAGKVQSRKVQLEGVFETGTGRPHEVRCLTTTVLDAGGEAKTTKEARSFVFDWTKAKLSGPKKGGPQGGGPGGAKPADGGGKKQAGGPGGGNKKKQQGQGGKKKQQGQGGNKKKQQGGDGGR